MTFLFLFWAKLWTIVFTLWYVFLSSRINVFIPLVSFSDLSPFLKTLKTKFDFFTFFLRLWLFYTFLSFRPKCSPCDDQFVARRNKAYKNSNILLPQTHIFFLIEKDGGTDCHWFTYRLHIFKIKVSKYSQFTFGIKELQADDMQQLSKTSPQSLLWFRIIMFLLSKIKIFLCYSVVEKKQTNNKHIH